MLDLLERDSEQLGADGSSGAHGPGNITASPYGGMILIARNERGGEFAGPVYSRDGRVLFANTQDPGTLYAITGPWRPR